MPVAHLACCVSSHISVLVQCHSSCVNAVQKLNSKHGVVHGTCNKIKFNVSPPLQDALCQENQHSQIGRHEALLNASGFSIEEVSTFFFDIDPVMDNPWYDSAAHCNDSNCL